MKKKSFTTALLFVISFSGMAQYTTLLPVSNCVYNLGSPTYNWSNLYLCNNVYIDNYRFLSNGGNIYNAYTGTNAGSTSNPASALYNVANGFYASFSNSTGDYNTAIGAYALRFNTASSITGTGYAALYNNTSGSSNTAHGYQSLYNNTTGSYNTANGYQAEYSNTTGYSNTVMGYQALYNSGITTGSYNVAVGLQAMHRNSGSYNAAVGILAGEVNSNYSTFLGWGARSVSGASNSAAIGYNSYVGFNNRVVIGNTSVSDIGGYAPWTDFSDGRFKKNQKENVPGLEFIRLLRPITYNLDVAGIDKVIEAEAPTSKSDKAVRDENAEEALVKAADAKSKIVYTGFVAQEVESAAKKVNYNFDGVKKPTTDKDFYGLRYGEFVVPLVKAVQELEVANAEKDKKIEKLEAEMEQLKNLISKISNNVALNEDAFLGQSVPNPSTGSLLIPFSLPVKYKTGSILITEVASGRIIKTIQVTPGQKNITVALDSYSSGIYSYSLIANGKTIDTKKMVLNK